MVRNYIRYGPAGGSILNKYRLVKQIPVGTLASWTAISLIKTVTDDRIEYKYRLILNLNFEL